MRPASIILFVALHGMTPWVPAAAQRLDRVAYTAPVGRAEISSFYATEKKEPSFVKHVAVGAGIGAAIGVIGGAAFTLCDSPKGVFCGQYEIIPMLMAITGLGGAYVGALSYLARRLFAAEPGFIQPDT
jgi:hypothetical protein